MLCFCDSESSSVLREPGGVSVCIRQALQRTWKEGLGQKGWLCVTKGDFLEWLIGLGLGSQQWRSSYWRDWEPSSICSAHQTGTSAVMPRGPWRAMWKSWWASDLLELGLQALVSHPKWNKTEKQCFGAGKMAYHMKHFPNKCENLDSNIQKSIELGAEAHLRSASPVHAATDNKETLFQTRWDARSSTRICLSSTCVLWLVHIRIHTCTWHTRIQD